MILIKSPLFSKRGGFVYYLYILKSENYPKTYVGSTENLSRRFAEHNRRKVKSSKAFAPYGLIYSEEFCSLKQARQREKYFKSTSGRREIKKKFFSC
ncbi:MAG: GIY-YIG nuclease family protein [Candidatus Omnitrophota bacterium]